MEYAFLGDDQELPVVIAKGLKPREKLERVQLLKRRKKAIAWKISDIKGINPSYCSHKILMEEGSKPMVQPRGD